MDMPIFDSIISFMEMLTSCFLLPEFSVRTGREKGQCVH